MSLVSIHNVGLLGVISDRPAHTLPPEAWSDAKNMRFFNNQARRVKGHAAVLGTPTVSPGFILNVPAGGNSFWLYGNLAHVYVNDGGVHTQITRAAGATPYNAANLWDWNTCFVGGIPILNNGVDVPQFWGTLSVGTDLADLTNWSTYPVANLRAKVIRSFGPFLVAMNTSDANGSYEHRLVWSSPAGVGAVPASWDVSDPAFDTGQADLTDILTGGIRDGLMLGNQFYIYKESATHAMRYIGGSEVMAFDFLFNVGLLAPRCVCLIDRGRKHFLVTEDDAVVHSGVKDARSVLEQRDRVRLFTELDQNARDTCFTFDNFAQNEAWFCYPLSGAAHPNRAMIYDYKRETISFRDWEGLDVGYGVLVDTTVETWSGVGGSWDSSAGPWNLLGGKGQVIAAPLSSKFYGLENADTYGSGSVESFLERTGLAIIGRDRQGEPKVDYSSRKQVSRVWPKLTGPGAGSVQVQVGAQEEIDGSIVWSLPKQFDPAVRYLDFDNEAGVVGRLNAIRMASTESLHWQCEGYDLEVNVLSSM